MNELTGDDKEKPYMKERPTYQKRKGERVRLSVKQAFTSLFTALEGMLMVFCLGGLLAMALEIG